jgi:hypothetical protein
MKRRFDYKTKKEEAASKIRRTQIAQIFTIYKHLYFYKLVDL